MDVHGQIGPEKGQYPEDVRAIAGRMIGGCTVHASLTDRMSRLDMLLTSRGAVSFYGDAPRGYEDGVWVHVAMATGSAWFDVQSYLAPHYVADKLGLHAGDGETVAEFLVRIATELGAHVG